MFNPAKAKEKEEQEEANRLASEWGSTPERAKEVVKKTKGEEDLSFQVWHFFFVFFVSDCDGVRVCACCRCCLPLTDTWYIVRLEPEQHSYVHRKPCKDVVM